MKVWTYVITNDSGVAPNFDPPMPTLAVCKPQIRRQARPGDLVLAFCGKSISTNPHAVRWAGIVCEVLTFTEYWNDPRFDSKKPSASPNPDNIYQPADPQYRQVPNTTHGFENIATDLRGQNVLVFNRHWHFESSAPELPNKFGLHMTVGRRGHRQFLLSKRNANHLSNWLTDQFAFGLENAGRKPVLGKSRNPQVNQRRRPPRC